MIYRVSGLKMPEVMDDCFNIYCAECSHLRVSNYGLSYDSRRFCMIGLLANREE